jgi:cobalt transport protein
MTSLSKTINLKQTVLLVAIVVFLAVIPLFLNRQSEFGGADAVAKEALVANNVQPWFKPLGNRQGARLKVSFLRCKLASEQGLSVTFSATNADLKPVSSKQKQ